MRLDNSCPFCGSDNASSRQMHSNDGWRYVVICNECGARGPGSKSLNGAIDAWTMRHPKPIWKRLEEEGKVSDGTEPV